MEVSGQLNAAAALPHEKELIVPTGEKPLVIAHGCLKIVFSLPENRTTDITDVMPLHGSPSSDRGGKGSIPDQSM
jgi:hypothetical protein